MHKIRKSGQSLAYVGSVTTARTFDAFAASPQCFVATQRTSEQERTQPRHNSRAKMPMYTERVTPSLSYPYSMAVRTESRADAGHAYSVATRNAHRAGRVLCGDRMLATSTDRMWAKDTRVSSSFFVF